MARNAILKSVKVRCLATSANLGPGFDVAGMALLEPYDVMEFEVAQGGGTTIANEGKYSVPENPPENTLGPVIESICREYGILNGFKITIVKNIKPASGLGSSASTAVGAAVALNALYGLQLTKKQLIDYAALGEKVAAGFAHTDNVSPGILGGIVFSSESSSGVGFVNFPPIELDLLVVLPDKEKGSTKKMRGAIPEMVEWNKARGNLMAQSALFASAIESNPEKFIEAVHGKDQIVEKARAQVPALDHLPAIQALGDKYGFGVFASGAGPAVIAACKKDNANKGRMEKDVSAYFKSKKVAVSLIWTQISPKGAEIIDAKGNNSSDWNGKIMGNDESSDWNVKMTGNNNISKVQCIECRNVEMGDANRCPICGGLLEILHDFSKIAGISKKLFESRTGSGVWRFKELIHPSLEEKFIISRDEGNTFLYTHKKVDEYAGIKGILLKHEGENPTGSFKDRGMTVAISQAAKVGAKKVACASTGNTSASMSAYASLGGIESVVFIPEGKIATGKLSQSLAYGAKIEQIKGNFDSAMEKVQVKSKEGGMHLLNSINPWRIEGQKTIIFEMLMQLDWESPDWIAVPAGNLGNTSAFGKALREAKDLGLIEKIPRLLSVQAQGAAPFYRMWKNKGKALVAETKPETIATAIRIGNPISWPKAIRAIEYTNGVVEQVTDGEIMDAKAVIDGAGIGCEPASAATIAGVKKLVMAGIIKEGEKIVCILTGNLLKDPDATIGYHQVKLGNLNG
ncbi:MAG: threonine synthase [Candidatus Micrarchaeota archaeon]